MGEVKGLIFDLDGVVVSTEQNHFESWKGIAEVLGAEFNEALNENLKGVSRADSLRFILENSKIEISDAEFEDLLIRKNDFYRKSISDLSTENILPGVIEVIEKAKAQGIKVMIGSSSRNARFILDKLGIIDEFDHIVDGNDVTFPKPHPEVFLNGAKLANLDPANCIVFEDAASGVKAAKEGGFKAVAVGNPHIKDLADEYYETLKEFTL
ncbi:MAG: beta-phosphoglucomutase [Crocinitomicaceae bacterium]